MALISGSIPNLINGVSQQPSSLRLPTQAQSVKNALCSVVKGLRKRPPTEHVAYVTGLPTTNFLTAYFHTMRLQDSDGVSRPYFMVVGSSGISVYNSSGVQQTVTDNTGGYPYFSGTTDYSSQISATTVADYTFILSKTKKAKKGTALTDALKHEAMIVIKQGDYSTDYKASVTHGGTSYSASYTTRNSGNVSHEVDAKTGHIANQLRAGLSSSLPSVFTVSSTNNVIYVTTTDNSEFSVSATDSAGDTHTNAIKGVVGSLKDLPSNGYEGFVVRVSGDTAKGQDDYFVKLRTTDAGSDTVWKETVGPSTLREIDAGTLPHKLVREADGSFTFSPVSWTERKAGDDDTNPFPSFANYDETEYPDGQYTINDIFFYKNRLCLLSDENLICSASGDFFAFFNQTVLTVLDDAPIDIAVSNNAVSILKYAVPFNNSLILFSDLTQFRVTSIDIFSAATISVNVSTQFEASLNSRPASAGKYVFFPTLRGIWSGVREYFVESDNDTNDAADITAHVPEYISGEVKQLVASPNEDILILRSSGDRQQVYVYNYYWQGRDKLQSAWSQWTFGNNVLFTTMDKSKIYFLMERAEGVAIETLNLSQDDCLADTSTFGIHLDRRFKRTASTDTLPYTGGSPISDTGDELVEATNVASNLDAGTVVYTGVPFNFEYEFSPIVIKEDDNPITQGRLQIRSINIVYDETSFFKASISRQGQTASIKTFTGRDLDGTGSYIGTLPIQSGSLKVPVLAESNNVVIKLIGNSFHPTNFQSAEWEATYHLRNKRT